MTQYLINDSRLTAIADAIREKGGYESLMTPLEMPGYISNIETSSEDGDALLYGNGTTPGSFTIVPFATGTDDQIAALIDAAHEGDVDLQNDCGWAVGDTRTINISAFTGAGERSHATQNVNIVITSFDDYMNCGCLLQFDFKNYIKGIQNYESGSNVPTGGYRTSAMKNTTLPALVNALPMWLKSRLIEFSCLASAGNLSSTIETVSGNKLALRSEVELTGENTYSYPGEGSQLAYYTNSSNRGKVSYTSVYDRGNYWLRSGANNYATYALYYSTYYGNVSTQVKSAGDYYYLAPFGCL